MTRLSVALAALLGLSACGGVPNDVPESADLQTQQAFELRRAQLRGEPLGTPDAASVVAPAAAPLDTPSDIATRAAAAIAEAEGAPTAPATAPAPVAAAPAQRVAGPAGRGLPALPASVSLPDDSAPGCAQFATAGAAQNWFIANGGPGIDPDNLDPDGDGRVCGWAPPLTDG
jgi:hypothetical protein